MSATLIVVPAGNPAGFTLTSLPPANSMRVPSASASSRVSSSSLDTAAIVGNASPRNPSVAIESRSSAERNLLVAWRSKASSASSRPRRWRSQATLSPPTPAARQLRPRRFCSLPLPAICVSGSFFLDRDPELIKLFFVDAGRRIRHQVLRGGGLCEGDDFADRLFASEEHHDAVDAERNSPVRRRAISQRIEKKAEAAAQLFFGQAERFEEALLNVLAVDSNAAGA